MNWFRLLSISLKWKFIIVFLLLVTLPTSLFGILVLRQTNHILNDEAIKSTDRLLNTIDLNINSILNNVEDISTYSIFSEETRNLLIYSAMDNAGGLDKTKEKVLGFFTFHLMSKPYINSIALYNIKKQSLLELGEPLEGNEERWSAKAQQSGGGIFWSDPYQLKSQWEGQKEVISLVRQIRDINHLTRPIGEIRIRLFEEKIYQMISNGVSHDTGSIFIVKQDGTVISHEDNQLLGKLYPDRSLIENAIHMKRNELGFRYKKQGRNFVVVSKKIESTNWFLIAMLDEARILKETEQVKNSYRMMIIAMLLLGMIVLAGFYYAIVRPIMNLIRETRKVERGDFTAHVKVTTGDELGILGKRFNKMVHTIQYLIDSKYKLEIKQKESDLKALQAQINPHFLYNTLDTIRWTARIEKAMKTSRLIETLSKFFRIGLSGGKVTVSLIEELNYTKSYLELQQERIGPDLKFSIFTDTSVDHLMVLKQMLQPLVENSIVHGFENMTEEKWIRIRCYLVEQELYIDLIDNGKGFSSGYNLEPLAEEGEGYAIKNIQDRIKLFFGADYGLEIIQHNGTGAWLRIRLPLVREAGIPSQTTNGSV